MEFRKDVARVIVYAACFLLIIYLIQPAFIAKAVEVNAYSPKATYEGFYEQPQNSITVLFLGTSHCYNSFSPEMLYQEYGINSYNLGSSMQSTVLSYYWLKEALRYQNPSFVVFEVYNMIPFGYSKSEDVLWNSTEAQIRQAVDYMKWSENKIECVRELCGRDITMEAESFVFPIIRYHDRWEELGEEDYNLRYLDSLKIHKGYKLVKEQVGDNTYEPLNISDSDNYKEKDVLITDYVDDIVNLCTENKIKLVFVRTPYVGASEAEYLQIKEYAMRNDIDYYDLNLKELYKKIDYDIDSDNVDSGHANVEGATKITSFIGKIIKAEDRV